MRSSATINNRYILLDVLGQGGMGAVYEATDRLTGDTVALKQVLVGSASIEYASRPPSGDMKQLRRALTREFRVLARLRHPHIASVLDYGFDKYRRPYYTMTLVEGSVNLTTHASTLTLPQKTDLLAQTLQALHYLHRQGVVHRDLKPDNVLVTADGQVKVMDFGLARVEQQLSSSDNDMVAGTIRYMSPELFESVNASIASDLYAFGVIAYEVLMGRYPYDDDNIAKLITAIMTQPVNYDGLPAPLALWLDDLLNKDPTQRTTSAYDALLGLYDAVGGQFPPESEIVRESFLQASAFVGRDAELKQLTDALDTRNTANTFFLIGGESGVGKSRLLDELRIEALVRYVVVMRGQAASVGSVPYQVWQEPLRLLLLYSRLSDDEAAILKPIIHDVEQLLGRPVPDAPIVDPADHQKQMFDLVARLIQRLNEHSLLLLEDLQWAGPESIQLLNYVNRTVVGKAAMMMVGSYRDDEALDLPEKFSNAQTLHLRRLEHETIGQLSASMLGENVGRTANVLALIERETEGNPFFIVEVVRALAEDAGQLERIGEMTLPRSVFPEGMKTVVQRRLKQMPPEHYPLLKVAAIMGRSPDLDLLSALDPNVNLVEWLNVGAEVSILEVVDGHWRFTHDKLRERILDDLTADERATLHRRVAETIEMCYPDDANQAATLARLWSIAQDREKELEWSQRAGDAALKTNVNIEAERYYRRALELTDATVNMQLELDLQLALAVALTATRGYGNQAVEDAYNRAYDLAVELGTTECVFRSQYGIVNVHSSRGELALAERYGYSLLAMTDYMEPPETFRMITEATLGLVTLRRGKAGVSLSHCRRALELYDIEKHRGVGIQFGFDPSLGSLSYGALAYSVTGDFAHVREWRQRAFDMAAALQYPFARIFALFYAGLMAYQVERRYQDIVRTADEVRGLAMRHDYPFFQAMCDILGGWAQVFMGEADSGLRRLQTGFSAWNALNGDPRDVNWISMLSEAQRRAGNIDAADAAIQSAQENLLGDAPKEGLRLPLYYNERALIKAARNEPQAVVVADFQRAIEISQSMDAKAYELQVKTDWAAYLSELGEQTTAIDLLKPIYNEFAVEMESPVVFSAYKLLQTLQRET